VPRDVAEGFLDDAEHGECPLSDEAARHLPLPALAKSVASSAAFDLVTLAQARDAEALKAVALGWRDGARGMFGERGAREASERVAARRRLVSFRAALREQRRLGRL